MTIALKSGDATGAVTAELDRSNAKCASAALAYLAGRNFYGETKCHELTHAEGSFALRCGDPSDTGNGGAAFTWFPENQPSEPLVPTSDPSASPAATPSPAAAKVLYPKGTIAMMPGVTGSQFLIFYKDSTISTVKYSIVGRVTSGLEFIDKIAEAGTVANSAGADTKPKNDVIIQTLTVVDNATTPTTSPQATTSPTAS
ncbi:MAG TPA: peptidylprolyl isomerase [Micromonosporaceae bacterium]|nr:peptidylprolyl isomerase [Micromonosporaceae bacterium]